VEERLLFDQARPIRTFAPTFDGAQRLDDLPGAFFGHRGEFLRLEGLHCFPPCAVFRARRISKLQRIRAHMDRIAEAAWLSATVEGSVLTIDNRRLF